VTILGSDGRLYQIQATLQSATPVSGAAQNEVALSITPCSLTCGSGLSYNVPVGAGAVSFETSPTPGTETASVVATFGGAPLRLSWSVDHAATSIGANVNGGSTGAEVQNPLTGGDGQLAVSLWHLNCTGEGNIADYVMVGTAGPSDLGGGHAPRRAPAGFTSHGRHHAGCAPNRAG
jgi:hypothetical protein